MVWTTYNIPSRHLEALPIFQILFLKTYIWIFVAVIVCVVGMIWLAVVESRVLWVRAALDISDVYEVAACAGLVLLSQCLFRYKVETYFRRADLV